MGYLLASCGTDMRAARYESSLLFRGLIDVSRLEFGFLPHCVGLIRSNHIIVLHIPNAARDAATWLSHEYKIYTRTAKNATSPMGPGPRAGTLAALLDVHV